MLRNKNQVLKELQIIPGVGKSISEDLYQLGIRSIADLKQKSPEVLYQRHQFKKGGPVDRCVLYVFRTAVYFAKTKKPAQEKLKWWNWKD